MSPVTRAHLEAVHDFAATHQKVRSTIQAAVTEPLSLVRFLGRYTSWNGYFGSAVSALAGKIGRCRGMFADPEQPIHALADRSVLVASFFFDAARDEFDDRDTLHRDTHRCLAQACLMGTLNYGARQDLRLGDASFVNELLASPLWLAALNDRVAMGYGAFSRDELPTVFRSMGYHLGSEVLADQEFSVIDSELRRIHPALVDYLSSTTVHIAGQDHNTYQWLRIHSGHGGGAEADHFAWAVQGVTRAFRYVPASLHDELRHQILLGFRDFAADHAEFFQKVAGAGSL